MQQVQVNIASHMITIDISNVGVHIYGDESLQALMLDNPLQHVINLADAAKNEFEKIHHKLLRINTQSLIVEIWGHYYLLQRQLPRLQWMHRYKLTKFIIIRLENSAMVYDCATFPTDKNRWVWDILAIAYPFWVQFFFRKYKK